MFPHGNPGRAGLSGFDKLKGWSEERWKSLTRDSQLRDYEDTLRRLLAGSFGGLSPDERREKADQVIRLSAMASLAMGATPIPFLELPVQMAMVRAIAKIHGANNPGRKVFLELAGALGGGLFFRQMMKMLPLVGPLPHLSRIYGATWALGRAACLYFDREHPLDPEDLRRTFRETAAERTREQSRKLEGDRLEEQLQFLDGLLARNILTEEEHRRKRADLVDRI